MSAENQLSEITARGNRMRRLLRYAFCFGVALALLVGINQPTLSTVIHLLTTLFLFGCLILIFPRLSQRKILSRPVTKLGLLLCSLAFALVFSEAGLRWFFGDLFLDSEDERTLMYRFDRTLGWFPREGSRYTFDGNPEFTVIHNSRGFRDSEYKDENRPAFFFIGDSMVWGYDAESEERFTDKLQARHPEITVYNFGVSGYGTDQSFLLLKKQMEKLRPSFVFLVFCTQNDEDDNSWSARHGGYYKPYFIADGKQLRLRGVPVPRSERAIRADHRIVCSLYAVQLVVRAYCKLFSPQPEQNLNPTAQILLEMHGYLSSRGIPFNVGFTRPHTNLQTALGRAGIAWLDLNTTNCYPAGEHWTLEGHDFVCEQIEDFVLRTPSVSYLLHNRKKSQKRSNLNK
jgi:hypothetical protein